MIIMMMIMNDCGGDVDNYVKGKDDYVVMGLVVLVVMMMLMMVIVMEKIVTMMLIIVRFLFRMQKLALLNLHFVSVTGLLDPNQTSSSTKVSAAASSVCYSELEQKLRSHPDPILGTLDLC